MRVSEAFPSKYLKASDLEGKPATVVIKNVEMVDIKDRNTGKNVRKPELSFRNTDKTMVLNVTNSNKISSIVGSDEMDDWIGQKIVLYPTTTEMGGEEVECIRVRAPSAKPSVAGGNGNAENAYAAAKGKAAPKPTPPAQTENPADDMDDEIPF